tara:strand:+ start:2102 stop:2383 length:282 start_codon:yes stop_codon:yes gene_type:complete
MPPPSQYQHNPSAPSLALTIPSHLLAAVTNTAQARPYDLTRRPITTFSSTQRGKTVLVATCYFETPLDENALVVQPGAAEDAWQVRLLAELHE